MHLSDLLNVSAWVNISQEMQVALVGVAGAVFGGLVTGAFDWIIRFRTRPRLKLDYLGGPGSKVEATYEAKGQKIERIFVRVRLRNKGKRLARECRVFLAGISEVRERNIHQTTFHDSKVLAWPGYPPDFAPRTIPAGIDAYVDLISVIKTEPGWHFHVQSLYASQQDLTKYKGTYRLKLLATAEDAKPSWLEVDVYYDHDWKSLRAITH